MKVIKVLFVSLMCLVNLVGCGSNDGLDKHRYSGQLIDLSYETFDEKIKSQESFIFYVTRKGCHACKDFYEVVDKFLEENDEKIIYTISESDMDAIGTVVMTSYFYDILGRDYYVEHDYDSTTLYTPSIGKVLNGELVDAEIGIIDTEELGYMYQDNYYSFDNFYSYNHKTIKKKTFDLFISFEGNEDYDDLLRNYYLVNSDKTGIYLNVKNFDESQVTKLLDRINYYLGEENSIENIPAYCVLQYEKGVLVNYVEGQFDVGSLDALYNK